MKYLDVIDPSAEHIGAVNTVLVTNEKLLGYNTDYYGFIESLKAIKFSIKNKNALIIGNGGSGKCIYKALRDLNIKNIHVIARNTLKSKTQLLGADNYLDLKDYNMGLNLEPYDIVVNCTPIGGPNYINEKLFNLTKVKPTTLVYDINYGNNESQLLSQAKQMGAQVMNGSLMLKNQAVRAMNIWIDYINEGRK
ncbi:MAG: aroE [Clostridiaceae bacterium]|nr:aroE [Clostridiaceae bacterium]